MMSFGFSGFRHLPSTLGRLAAGLAVLLAAGEARAATCPADLPPPQVSVAVERGEVRLDHSLSPDGIGKVRADIKGVGAVAPAGRTLGLTMAAFRLGKSTEGRMLPAGPGRWCVQVTRINLRIGFTGQTVFVPRDYMKGSCEFEAIMAHEEEHVGDNLAVLDDFTEAFKVKAQSLAETMKPILVSSREEARRKPMELVTAALEPLAADFATAQALRAAHRDTPQEYAAVAARCANW